MSSSIVSSLPALHATLLGIIVAFTTAYTFFAYQNISSVKNNLIDIKRQLELVSKPGSFSTVGDFTEFQDEEGVPDWDKVMRAIDQATRLFSDVDFVKYGGEVRKTILIDDLDNEDFDMAEYHRQNGYNIHANYIRKSEIRNLSDRLLYLLPLVLSTYPYSKKSSNPIIGTPGTIKRIREDIKIDDTSSYRKWISELSKRNGYIKWLWDTRQGSIAKLMDERRILEIDENEKKCLVDFQRYKETLPEPYKSSYLEFKNHYCNRPVGNYMANFQDSMNRILYIENNLMVPANNSIFKLESYEKQFKIKKHTVWILGFSIIIFIAGIIFPVIYNAYAKEPRVISFEIGLFIATMIPYLFGLSYLFKLVLGLKYE